MLIWHWLLGRHYKNEISTEARFRKYIKLYSFLSFARKFGDKYGKKLMDTATKTGIDPLKTASKRVFQKTTQATGDLFGNIIADKITSVCKSKEKEKAKKAEETYISPEKRQQIIDEIKLFWAQNVTHHCIKMEFQKIVNLIGITSDDKDLPRFITNKWIEVNQKKITMLTKKLKLKHQS